MKGCFTWCVTVFAMLLLAAPLWAQTQADQTEPSPTAESPATAQQDAQPVETTQETSPTAEAPAVTETPAETPAAAEPPAETPAVTEKPVTAPPPAPVPPPQPEPEVKAEEIGELESIDSLEELEELEQLEKLDEAELAEKEQLKFFELNGYYRLRADLFHNLDIGVFNDLRPLGDIDTLNSSKDKRKDNTIGTANMRLRLSPTLNVSEDIKIMMDIDILDNVVLGSTPDTYLRGGPGAMAPGISGFSSSQVVPRAGANSDVDSIQVRRVWAEVRTPFGLLKFGRMPSHWGTGMFINDGNSIDSDYGDTVDRILFGTKLFEHVLFAGMDFVNEGVTNDTTFEYGGQDVDATQLDDVQQVVFGFARKHSDAEAQEMIENMDVVIDYGFYNVVRWQSYALEQSTIGSSEIPYGYTAAGDFESRINKLRPNLIERNLRMWIGDLWFKLLYENFHLEAEGIWIIGSIGDAAKDAAEQISMRGKGLSDNSLDINQWGYVLKLDYTFMDDTLFIGLEHGIASGDPAPGFGVYPYEEKQFSDEAYRRTANGPLKEDRAVTNLRFDPDYHIDMILWREIIGTITDAIYVKPTLQYNITPSIGARLDAIFSWAYEADSTPSYDHKKYETWSDFTNNPNEPTSRQTSRWLGVELDVEVFYKSFDGFGTGLAYGVFFPGSGFGYWDPSYVQDDGTTMPTWFNAPNVAQTLQWRLSIEF